MALVHVAPEIIANELAKAMEKLTLKIESHYGTQSMSLFDQQIKRIQKARTKLLLSHPFFAQILIGYEIKDMSTTHYNCPTMCTDGKMLGINSQWVDSLTQSQLITVLAHEAMHTASLHHVRIYNVNIERDIKKFTYHEMLKLRAWNYACDYAINHLLEEGGFTNFPDGACVDVPYIYKNKTAEYIYYDLISKIVQEDESEGQLTMEGVFTCEDDNKMGGVVFGSPDLLKREKTQGGKEDESDGQGSLSDQELKDMDFGSALDKQPNDEAGMTKDDIKDLENAEQNRLVMNVMLNKDCGTIPGSMKRFVEDLIEPKQCYKELLHNFMERITNSDYSFMHPNRKYYQLTKKTKTIIPGQYSEELGEIVIMVDTSGSVSPGELKVYASEISSILEEFPTIDILVLYIDTRLQHHEEFTHDDLPIKLRAQGGGGTSFKPGFEYLKDKDIEPLAVLYFTDGWSYELPPEPDYPVLWMITGKYEYDDFCSRNEFGEAILLDISDDDKYRY